MTKQATARKARNVVRFPAAGPPGSPKPSSDRTLIADCIAYAQAVAAYHAGFEADPDGSNDDAARLGDRYLTVADELLAEITRKPATTAAGLQAKARIVPAIIKNDAQSPDEREEAFLLSLAADVTAFLQPIVDNEWRARLPNSSDVTKAETVR